MNHEFNKNTLLHELDVLQVDLKNNSDKWENVTLLDFLEGMKGYIHDTLPEHSSSVSISKLVDILRAARVYE